LTKSNAFFSYSIKIKSLIEYEHKERPVPNLSVDGGLICRYKPNLNLLIFYSTEFYAATENFSGSGPSFGWTAVPVHGHVVSDIRLTV
jgi:hypothetical protein